MRKIYPLLLILLSSITTFAQAPRWEWAKEAGHYGTWSDTGYDIVVDENGNSYQIGSFQSPSITFGNTTLYNNFAGMADIFIVKHDAFGNAVWAQSFGGNNYDMGQSIALDSNGNLYITGFFSSPTINLGNTTLTNADNTGNTVDVFVAKIDTSGIVLWAASAGGSLDDEAYSISTDSNGNSYLTGCFQSSSIAFGGNNLTRTSTSFADIFIVKYGPSGNTLWAQSAKEGISYYYGYGVSIAADNNGNSYITGYYNAPTITFDSITLTNADNTGTTTDIFIVKYDASGNVLWAQSLGGALADYSTSISADAKGNFYITGSFRSNAITFGSTTLTNIGNSDMFIVKYNGLGNVLWAQPTGGSFNESGTGIYSDANGNIYTTGYFASSAITFGNITLPSTDSTGKIYNVFVTKHDALGNVLWAQSSGGPYSGWGESTASDSNGNSYTIGNFEYLISFGNINLTNSGIFIAKLSSPTGIEENNSSNTINIYPNPSNGQINITSSNNIYELKITNILGQVIYQEKPKEKNISVQMDKTGIYFVTIISHNKTATKRFVVD